MDFITGLPASKGKTVILVVVDRLSKGAHFVGLSSKFTAQSVAAVFVQEISRLHGFPTSIISDRDPIFMSAFWQEFFALSGTVLKHSSSYHPETDGQSEVTNRGLEQYLRCYCMDRPHTWFQFLPWAELSYNTAKHSGTKYSPFFIMYGRHPPSLWPITNKSTSSLAVREQLETREAVLKELKANLHEAQNRMKQKADHHRRELQFNVGDRVLVKLQPYRQTLLASQPFSKLRRRFFGPFLVIQKIGTVAYKLDLPASSRIHPVFHISKLKIYREDATIHPSPFPPAVQDGLMVAKPLDILSQQWVMRKGIPKLQILVHWEHLSKTEATWLDLEDFQKTYPSFNLEGKVNLERGSDDTGWLVYARRPKT